MPDEQLHGAPANGAPQTSGASEKGSFWRTLPGILTAAGTFLAGLAGLAAVVVPSIFPRDSGGPAPDPGSGPQGDVFIAARAPDGFVAMRVQPSRTSAEITRISVGDKVRCGSARPNDQGYPWRRCRDADGNVGYMSDNYLREP